MKATPLFVCVLGILLASAPRSDAAGVNLAWNHCLSEGGSANRDFACATNTGGHVIVASFELSSDQEHCTGMEATIEITAKTDGLPSWWQFYNAGSCRRASLSTSFDFSSEPATSCTDMWSGQGVGGIGAYQTYWTLPQVPSGEPSQARLRIAAAVPSTIPMQLASGTEYYAFKLIVNNAKTVGSSSCGGCETPVCVPLSELNAVQSDNQDESLTQAATSNLVTWQQASDCPGGMAQQNITWGQIRSLSH